MSTHALNGAVVVIRFSSMGDCVLATGVVAELAMAHPRVPLVVVTKPAFQGIFELVPGVSRVLVLDVGRHGGVAGLGRLARDILQLQPSRIIDLHGTLRARLLRLWILWLAPSLRWRSVAKHSLRRRWLAWVHSRREQPHITARYAQAALEGRSGPVAPRIQVPGPVMRQRSVALVPGAAWATKMWPIEYFVAMAAHLLAAGYAVRVLGGDKEAALAASFGHLSAAGAALSLEFANRPMGEIAAVLASQQVVVANDTGLMHLATAVGTPVLALFGPTAPSLGFAPTGAGDQVAYRGESCSPCTLHGQERCPRGHHRCMRDLDVASVMAKLQTMLKARESMA